jgi:hypothetical protein
MSPTRMFVGVTRSMIGIGAWVAPDTTTRLFGIDPARSDRFVARLYGARELTLGVTLLTASPSALATVASVGAAVDAADVVSGFDEFRRGNLSTQATVLGLGGALLFAALGVIVAREASAAAPADQ